MGRYSQAAGQVGLAADNEVTALAAQLAATTADRDAARSELAEIKATLAAAMRIQPWQPGDPTFTPPTKTPPIVGVNYHGVWNDRTPAVRKAILDQLQAAGVRWVRLDIAWADFQPQAGQFGGGKTTTIDTVVNELSARGMKILLLIYWAPAWATGTANKNGVPRNPEDYALACAWAAQRWAGKVHAIELWNEPDLDTFLADQSPATWTRLVKAAYPKIKAAVPSMTVVAGAASAMKMDFYRTAYGSGLAGSYDVLGVHSYQGDASAPPDAYDKNYLQYYTANLPNVTALMAANGDAGKKLWITEYGWSVRTNDATTKVWEKGVTADTQATNLIAMQAYVAQWPAVAATFWYNDWNKATGNPFQDGFGLLNRDLTRKPAWYAMRCAAGGSCGK